MLKKIIEAEMIENSKIAEGIYRMALKAPEISADACPGQFVNIYLGDKSMLLPRPLSISSAQADTVTLIYKVVGKGTAEMAAYRPGELVRLSTNLGNGFQIETMFRDLGNHAGRNKVIALAGGGMGTAPLAGLAKTIAEEKTKRGLHGDAVQVISIIGFQEEPILLDEFERYCSRVYTATENGSSGFKGNVLQLIEQNGLEADYCFACGPKPMLRALAHRCESAGVPLQVSLEERMGCGYGACVGCVCQTRVKEAGAMKVKLKKVCTDGPVFFGDEVVWDE